MNRRCITWNGSLLWISVVGILAAGVGCERSLPTMPEEVAIDGYRIEGTVTTDLGQPLTGVVVRLSYDLEYLDEGPEPSRSYTVHHPGQRVTVAVYDDAEMLIRVLADENVAPGEYMVLWDQRDDQGREVPAGIYAVRYSAALQVQTSYLVLVHGTRTAVSDSLGKFCIVSKHLPIGYAPVPVYSRTGDVFYGRFAIGQKVWLEFSGASSSAIQSAVLRRNRLTTLDVRLN